MITFERRSLLSLFPPLFSSKYNIVRLKPAQYKFERRSLSAFSSLLSFRLKYKIVRGF